VKGRRRRRGEQLLDDIQETTGYWKWKQEGLYRTVWRTGFGRGCEPLVRQTAEWGMNESNFPTLKLYQAGQFEIRSRMINLPHTGCYKSHVTNNTLVMPRSYKTLRDFKRAYTYACHKMFLCIDMDMSYARRVRTASLTSYSVSCKILHQRTASHS
jgi:hypothetical protein